MINSHLQIYELWQTNDEVELAAIDCKREDDKQYHVLGSDRAWDSFIRYHRANPHLWQAFKRYTDEAIAAGVKHLGSMDIVCKIRWNQAVERGGGEYKITNGAGPYYARVFQCLYDDHKDFFATKDLPMMGIISGGA